ncbi:hypothetical protein BT69DRAFT_1324462 [Atractiella rhizophila]|nr:hypothetical protein BT69DRAFT_1324462 [Atractiella rhizophila]
MVNPLTCGNTFLFWKRLLPNLEVTLTTVYLTTPPSLYTSPVGSKHVQSIRRRREDNRMVSYPYPEAGRQDPSIPCRKRGKNRVLALVKLKELAFAVESHINIALAAYLKQLWVASPQARGALDLMRPRTLPLSGVWPYAGNLPPAFTLFSNTKFTDLDPPGLSPYQLFNLAWCLPEFDYQEKPEEEPKGPKFAGMTTEEAVSHELVARKLVVGS